MINKKSFGKLYSQIYDEISEKINRGEFSSKSRLPTIEDLCEYYSVSRTTVVKALDILKNENLIYSVQGKGYFVNVMDKINHPVFKLSTFSEDVRKYDLLPSSTVQKSEFLIPSVDVSNNLKIPEHTPVFYLHRIREANNQALIIEKRYINEKYCPGIHNFDFTKDSLYSIMNNDYGLHFEKSEISIESVFLRKEEAEIFDLPYKHPAFLSRVTVFLTGGIPIEYTAQIMRGDRFRLISVNNGYQKIDFT